MGVQRVGPPHARCTHASMGWSAVLGSTRLPHLHCKLLPQPSVHTALSPRVGSQRPQGLDGELWRKGSEKRL